MASRRGQKNAAHCRPEWCPIEATLDVIGGMWKVVIVRELLQGTRRYGELHRGVPGATHKMLTQQLRELERDGVLTRRVYLQVPPKVEYTLTPFGRRLAPVLDAMHDWGAEVVRQRARVAEPA
jgi:DNA-binding HxlR family transcriptional regulator